MYGVSTMQISHTYATHAIFQTNSSCIARKNSLKTQREPFDTVSISDEAREAYKNFKLDENKPSTSENNQVETKLTMWFNTWHTGADFQVKENIEIERGSGTILPENKMLKSKFEKEIDEIQDDEQVSAALEQSFLNILKDTQGSSFIQSTI